MNRKSKWIVTFCQRNSRYDVVLGCNFSSSVQRGVDEQVGKESLRFFISNRWKEPSVTVFKGVLER